MKTLGPKVWPSRLKPLHGMLSTDARWKVRRSVAFSIHTIAQALGPELTTKDLMPLVFRLLQDIPDVAAGVLENVAPILEAVPVIMRDSYLDHFMAAQSKLE